VQAHHAGFAVHAAFPGAEPAMFPDAVEVLDHLDLSALTCRSPRLVVVATQGKRDQAGLVAALETGAAYIAFVASARKAAKLKSGLKERGHNAAQVDAIRSPAGIEIGAVTPEEIAVSVLAGVIHANRSGTRAGNGATAEAVDRDVPPVASDTISTASGSCCSDTADAAPPAALNGSACCGGESTPQKPGPAGMDAA
jgi:xanthine dehydrogenase accessory factor